MSAIVKVSSQKEKRPIANGDLITTQFGSIALVLRLGNDYTSVFHIHSGLRSSKKYGEIYDIDNRNMTIFDGSITIQNEL